MRANRGARFTSTRRRARGHSDFANKGLVTHPWDFDGRKISVPTFLWQGERDRNVPEIHGKWLARAIPGCRATFYPQDAHLLVPLDHQREIYGELSRTLRAEAQDTGAQTAGFCR